MNIEEFKKLLEEKINFDKIFYKLGRFVAVVENIDYKVFGTKLNEISTAELWNMGIRKVSNLEIKESYFECVVEIDGNIELEGRALGERIRDAAEVNFRMTVLGSIKNDEVVIDYINGIKANKAF